MSEITSKTIETAYADSDNFNIIKSVTRQYARVLTKDEQENCGLYALWHTLEKHRNDHPSKQKFTTSLWRHTHWECQTTVRQLKRTVSLDAIGDRPARQDTEATTTARDCLAELPKKYRRLLEQYYLQNMSLEEVGTANGFSRETARTLITRAKRKLRRLMEDGVFPFERRAT